MNPIIEKIQEKVDIVELFGELFPSVDLKKSGSGFKALCPFHHEKTPSFSIKPDSQIFKCFGCDIAGNIVTLAKLGNKFATNGQAIAWLAKKADIKIDEPALISLKYDYTIDKIMYAAWGLFKKYLDEEDPEEERSIKKWLEKEKKLNNWEKLPVGKYTTSNQLRNDLLSLGFKEEEIERSGLIFIEDEARAKQLNVKTISGKIRGWAIYPYYSYYNRISRFKVRNPYSDSKKDSMYYIGVGTKGIYGLDLYDFRDTDRCFVVEGENDLLSIQNLFINETGKSVNVLCGGGGSTQIKDFRNLGIANLWIIPDNDMGGIKFIQHLIGEKGSSDVGILTVRIPEEYKDPYLFVQDCKTTKDFLKILEGASRPAKWIAETYIPIKMKEYVNDKKGRPEESIPWARNKSLTYAAKYIHNEMDMDDFIKAASPLLECREESLRKELGQITQENKENGLRLPVFVNETNNWVFKRTSEGETPLANFHLILTKDTQTREGPFVDSRVYEGMIVGDGRRSRFTIDAKKFSDDRQLISELHLQGGSWIQIMDPGKKGVNLIRLLAGQLNKNIHEDVIYKTAGFLSDQLYASRSVIITPEEIRPNDEFKILKHTQGHAKHLDFKILSPEREMEVLRHMYHDLLNVTDHSVTYPLMAFMHMPILDQLIGHDQKFFLWIYGLTGKGKSFTSRSFQCFWGDFFGESRVSGWQDTANAIQVNAHDFKDATVLVDDWKTMMVARKTQAISILQQYADRAGRQRLNPDASIKEIKYIRGWLHCTGEDIPTSQASVLARSIIVPWVSSKTNIEAGKEITKYSPDYPGYLPGFIQFVMANDPMIYSIKFVEFRDKMFDTFSDPTGEMRITSSDLRISNNLALLKTAAWAQLNYALYKGVIDEDYSKKYMEEFESYMEERRQEMSVLITGEMPGVKIVNILRQLIHTGRVTIINENESSLLREENNEEKNRSYLNRVVGMFKNFDEVHWYGAPDLIIDAVSKTLHSQGSGLGMSPKSIKDQLIDEGFLYDSKGDRITRDNVKEKKIGVPQRGFRGDGITRWWKFRKDDFGIDTNYSMLPPSDDVDDLPFLPEVTDEIPV